MRSIITTVICGGICFGCGGGNNGARVHIKPKKGGKDSFSATVEWNIVEQIDQNQLSIITRHDSSEPHYMSFDLPQNIISMMVRFGESMLIKANNYEKQPNHKLWEHDQYILSSELKAIHQFDMSSTPDCWSVTIIVCTPTARIVTDLSWLDNFQEMIVSTDSMRPVSELNVAYRYLGGHMRWSVKRCRRSHNKQENMGDGVLYYYNSRETDDMLIDTSEGREISI